VKCSTLMYTLLQHSTVQCSTVCTVACGVHVNWCVFCFFAHRTLAFSFAVYRRILSNNPRLVGPIPRFMSTLSNLEVL